MRWEFGKMPPGIKKCRQLLFWGTFLSKSGFWICCPTAFRSVRGVPNVNISPLPTSHFPLPTPTSHFPLPGDATCLRWEFVKIWIWDMPPDCIWADVGAAAAKFGRARGEQIRATGTRRVFSEPQNGSSRPPLEIVVLAHLQN